MTTGRLIPQDEKLHRATSRVLTDLVISQSASDTDITSGIYKPKYKIASLINFDNLLIGQRKIAAATIQAKNQSSQSNDELDNSYKLQQGANAITRKPQRGLKVFLCHSSGDKHAVEKFYDLLVEEGIDVWLDKKNLLPGQRWQVEIPKAVKNSDIVIVFLSAQSVTKEGFVQKEIKIALDTADEKPEETIFIIPAKLENCEVPERLSTYQWVDLFENDGYERLLKALQARARSLDIGIISST